ncbi:MAG TPA: AmmeMemoRadiSam system protein B [Burkholderiales bacterium]|nr:AmmeMemoRadiSam system protein B [Burkholderiales bacterium]
MASTRPPAVAGLFYPSEARDLQREVARLLAAASTPARAPLPKALLVPHAGYVYSGPVAASGYARIAPLHGRIERVVLLGPAHRVAVRGLALPSVDAFATPLGAVRLDRPSMQALAGWPQVCVSDRAHAEEHSLEVHLPFLQALLEDFSLVPFAVGDATEWEVAAVLERLWGGDETLVVVSSDLSHYLPYTGARAMDEATARRILRLEPGLDHDQACGAAPINGLLVTAQSRRLGCELIDLRNSGDTAGDCSRVVGYGAFGFYESGRR